MHPIYCQYDTGKTMSAQLRDTSGVEDTVSMTEDGTTGFYYTTTATLAALPLADGDYAVVISEATDGNLFTAYLRWSGTAELQAATPAEVNAQADQALSDYDPPTRTEATADKDEILSATGTGTGTGARTVAITVDDGTTALENARVRVTEGSNTYVASTNASGQVTFNIDDATYVVAITKSGYTYGGSSLVVDGDEAVTLSMTAITPTASPAGFSTGYLYAYDELGDAEVGVTFTLYASAPPAGSGIAVDSATRTATSVAGGYVEFAGLVQGAKYNLKRGGGVSAAFVCPDDDSFAIDNVIGVDE